MNSMKLEVDPSIIERNLDFRAQLLKEEVDDDPLSKLFPRNSSADDVPWKAVVPKPGFVIKLKTLEGDKVFVNVCHCPDVPAPKDITGDELIALLESDDPSTFTVPMSIGDLHVECDNSGNLASAYDIAINTGYYNKIRDDELFKNFFLSITMQGVEEKHKLQFDRESKIVTLKNRKCFGTLQSHRIQQRPVRTAPTNLIQELPDTIPSDASSTNKSSKKPLIEELPDSVSSGDINSQNNSNSEGDIHLPVNNKNRVRIIKIPKDGPPEKLVAFISISAFSGKELELDVGEDRILVNSPRKQEMLDFFIPHRVDRDKVTAKYLVNTQTLRVELPAKVQ
ncbi:hypothetical protein O3M35_001124 [Rhynocoris fuscipes]|uniref:PIH1 domain-containing protein 1 n=1 Tax=Rhynocoris fuscipes TaxID=488301 RepID=A0AAW1DS45_9HEMI